MSNFNVYGEDFSKVYDRFWQDFIDNIGPQIISLTKFHLPTQNQLTALDLFCGTGRLSTILLQQGFNVVGIDKSQNMLKIARQKISNTPSNQSINFIQGDAINFNIKQKFDIVISTFDSINHLKDLEEVKACFQSVYDHMKNRSLFLFDLNSEQFLKNWNFVDLEESEDKSIIYIMHGKYQIGEDKAYTRVIGFIDEHNSGNYRRFDEIMYNSLFPIEDILHILKEIGFSDLKLYDEDLRTEIESSEKINDRIFILAVKVN